MSPGRERGRRATRWGAVIASERHGRSDHRGPAQPLATRPRTHRVDLSARRPWRQHPTAPAPRPTSAGGVIPAISVVHFRRSGREIT